MNLSKNSLTRMAHIYNLLLVREAEVVKFECLEPNVYQLNILLAKYGITWSYILMPQGIVECV